MLDRLTSMAVFVRAAEAGSFAAVAESLGMTPQMVAKHIAALERQLGTRLIQRTTRRQSLTEFGQLYRSAATPSWPKSRRPTRWPRRPRPSRAGGCA